MPAAARHPAASRRELFQRLALGTAPGSDVWIRVHRPAMACRFEIALSGEDARHLPAARAALDEVDRIEDALTVFRATSTLSDLNRRAASEAVPVGPELFGLLARCRELHVSTDGAFDIASTALSRCWGFLRRQGRLPASPEIAAARAISGMDLVTLDDAARTVRFARPGVELNLNAVGKGYALDRIARSLRGAGVTRALLSAGGSSVLAIGGPFPVAVHPRRAAAPLTVWLRDAALGTSGAGEQFVEIDGRRYGHVLDPRTGWPAEGTVAVTVATGDAACADALSTAFLVGGGALAARCCTASPDVLALVWVEEPSRFPLAFGAAPGVTLAAEAA